MLRRAIQIGFVPLFAVVAFSQQPLYNKDQDEKAKAAAALLPGLNSSVLFERQLHNAEIVAQQESARFFQEARRRMRSTIDGFVRWSDIDDLIRETKQDLSGGALFNAEAEKAKLQKQLDALNASATAFEVQASAGGSEVVATVLAQGGKVRPVSEFAQKLLGEGVLSQEGLETIGEVGNAIEQMAKAYEVYARSLREIRQKQEELRELEEPLRRISLDLLLVEIDHWANVASIRERRQKELEAINSLVRDCEALLANLRREGRAAPGDVIAQTVAETMNLPVGGNVLLTLHCAAGIAARGKTPRELAVLRLGREEHLHVIRRSAVRARAVELTVTSGVQRLALLYQGGIKVTQIAQLLQTLAAIATPPVIAAY